MPASLQAPFPWFGGKARAAPLIWARLGDVRNYCEPFFGSGAVLLGRPHAPGIETVNDLDGFVCNAWRAIVADPEGTAGWSAQPVNECDLHARHLWLRARRETLSARLMGSPDYYDAQIAGWWLWGLACWIGGGFCGPGGVGPWGTDTDGRLVHLGDAGQGVTRKRPHLGAAGAGMGVCAPGADLLPWFRALQARLRRVRVCCGDWQRILGPSVTTGHGVTGVVLDPPYGAEAGRAMTLYAEDSGALASDVRAWGATHGADPGLRIVLCGYAGEGHEALEALGWSVEGWKAKGGYGSQGEGAGRANADRERLWFSPACLGAAQPTLF